MGRGNLLLIIGFFLFFLTGSTVCAKLPARQFPVSPEMRVQVDFWKKVYTKIDRQHAFLHDSKKLNIIYQTIKLPKGRRRTVQRYVERKKVELRRQLNSIINKKRKGRSLNGIERRLYKKIGKPSLGEVRRMRSRIRMQRGLKKRYRQGLVESFRYIEWIKKIFKQKKMPQHLAYLPHVESSFNYMAYSKVGAAGIWQFMRSTARRYKLKIDYVRDERRDPIKATKAAARLLHDNYRRFKSWPLAITAYNFGPGSISRAVKKVGSNDLSYIIRHYRGRRFGFASKNFYATFVAAAELSDEYKKYFPGLKPAPVFKYSTLKLRARHTISQLSKTLNIKKSTLKEYNKVLRPVAFRRNIPLPWGFELKIPAQGKFKLAALQKRLDSTRPVSKNLVAGGEHRVRRGESLYLISRRYDVSMSQLIAFNNIENPSKIFPGTRLQIPTEKAVKTAASNKKKKKVATKKSVTVATKKPSQSASTLVSKTDDHFFNSYHLEMEKVSRDRYRVTVEIDETLGHLADWAGVSSREIRRVNHLGNRSTIYYGQKLIVPLAKKRLLSFNIARIEHHQGIEEDFYDSYKVEGERSYLVRNGDTLEEIVEREQVPLWLLKKHWPKGRPFKLLAGEKIVIPVVSTR